MTFIPQIYDWRSRLCPLSAVFEAGGTAIEGGFTAGGAAVSNPEPGGRGQLFMTFPTVYFDAARSLDVSWTISRVQNGAVMRVRLPPSRQLVTASALTVDDTGLTWANGEPWANDENWRANPWVPVTAAGERGGQTFGADFSTLGEVLSIGHVVGFHVDGLDFAHKVMEVEYSPANIATVTVSPPLRRAIPVGADLRLRPSFLGVVRGAARGQTFRRLGLGLASEIRMVESLV